jgi:hypothetical protein
MKAVFNLPEKPNSCKAAVRAASVPIGVRYALDISLAAMSQHEP